MLAAVTFLSRGTDGMQLAVRPLVSLRGWAAPAAGVAGGAWPAAAAAVRRVWSEAAPREEVANRDSFYDNVVETWATKVRTWFRGGEVEARVLHAERYFPFLVTGFYVCWLGSSWVHARVLTPPAHPPAACAQADAATAAQFRARRMVRARVATAASFQNSTAAQVPAQPLCLRQRCPTQQLPLAPVPRCVLRAGTTPVGCWTARGSCRQSCPSAWHGASWTSSCCPTSW